jgi:L-rhamnose mutarotase
MTQRFASVIRLLPEREAEYRQLHAAVWPGVLSALSRAGIRNYSIFLRDGVLFSYLEYIGDDYERDMAIIADDDETKRWWTLTEPCQAPVDGAAATEWWAPADEVFHFDGSDPAGTDPTGLHGVDPGDPR